MCIKCYWKTLVTITLFISAFLVKLHAEIRLVNNGPTNGKSEITNKAISAVDIRPWNSVNNTIWKRFSRRSIKVNENFVNKRKVEDLHESSHYIHGRRRYEGGMYHESTYSRHSLEYPDEDFDPMLMGEEDLTTRENHLHNVPEDDRTILGRCDMNQQCKPGQYCDDIYCYKCKTQGEHCTANGQCCKGSECEFGYCSFGASVGSPGTYCDKSKDCKGADACCILEISIDPHNPLCKPMLDIHETCGPINLFHQIFEDRAHNEPICGPCKPGLACKSVGIHGHHSVCLPDVDHD